MRFSSCCTACIFSHAHAFNICFAHFYPSVLTHIHKLLLPVHQPLYKLLLLSLLFRLISAFASALLCSIVIVVIFHVDLLFRFCLKEWCRPLASLPFFRSLSLPACLSLPSFRWWRWKSIYELLLLLVFLLFRQWPLFVDKTVGAA